MPAQRCDRIPSRHPIVQQRHQRRRHVRAPSRPPSPGGMQQQAQRYRLGSAKRQQPSAARPARRCPPEPVKRHVQVVATVLLYPWARRGPAARRAAAGTMPGTRPDRSPMAVMKAAGLLQRQGGPPSSSARSSAAAARPGSPCGWKEACRGDRYDTRRESPALAGGPGGFWLVISTRPCPAGQGTADTDACPRRCRT